MGHASELSSADNNMIELSQRGGCGESRVQEIRLKCGIEEGAPVLDRQFMFTVYLHPHKDYQGYQPGSVFHGREIADRIPVRKIT